MWGWLGRKLIEAAEATQPRDASNDFWFEAGIGGPTAANVRVTPETALKLTSVVTALSVLADPIATLPLVFFRRQPDGRKEQLTDYPLRAVLAGSTSMRDTATTFRGQMQFWLGQYSNAYAEIVWAPDGRVLELSPMHPKLVRPRRVGPDGDVVYDYHEPGSGTVRRLHESRVWHLKLWPFTDDGLCGISRIQLARETIAMALAAQDYGARYFANDTRSGGIVQTTREFRSVEDRENFMAALRRSRTGVNAHRDLLLKPGMEYKVIAMTNREAQFLETRKALDLEVARLWSIPAHLINNLERATHSNIEHQSLEFITHTLMLWIVTWERFIKLKLIRDADVFCEFNVAGLLRGDLKTRYEAYAIAVGWGWLSVNEIRTLENLDPVPDGDRRYQPLNMERWGHQQPMLPQPGSDLAAHLAMINLHDYQQSAAGLWLPVTGRRTNGDARH